MRGVQADDSGAKRFQRWKWEGEQKEVKREEGAGEMHFEGGVVRVRTASAGVSGILGYLTLHPL